MDSKVLVVFDTNLLLQNDSKYDYYNDVNLGGEFHKLVEEFIPQHHLSNNVIIGIPQITIEEIKQQKYEKFENKFKSLSDTFNLIKNLTNLSEIETLEPKNYKEILSNNVDSYIENIKDNRNAIVLNYPKDNHLNRIIFRAVKRQTPFLRTKNESDKGFKDVVLWHSILDYEKINDFKKVILFSNDGGFDLNCVDEMKSLHDCDFEIIKVSKKLRDDLLAIYPKSIRDKIKIRSKVETPYFKENINNFLYAFCEEYEHLSYISVDDYFIDGKYVENDDNTFIELTLKVSLSLSYENTNEHIDNVEIILTLDEAFEIVSIDDSEVYEIHNELVERLNTNE